MSTGVLSWLARCGCEVRSLIRRIGKGNGPIKYSSSDCGPRRAPVNSRSAKRGFGAKSVSLVLGQSDCLLPEMPALRSFVYECCTLSALAY
ncbi:unnamed protein product [Leptosia nina]|uniref:Uncharacterized protein n=1 Tax=Leptosia nina TaxID=320188 RepID=A0AAV1J592_9NEOP